MDKNLTEAHFYRVSNCETSPTETNLGIVNFRVGMPTVCFLYEARQLAINMKSPDILLEGNVLKFNTKKYLMTR